MLSVMNNNLNIDPMELDKFESLAAEWWDPRGKLKTLHVINPVRLKYINDAVDLRDRQVLDIGCGGGLLCEAMAGRSARVTGIDFSRSSIEVAKQHQTTGKYSIDYLTCTVEEFESRYKQRFNVITCMEMLEHVPDPAAIIDTAARLLKPGGHIFLSTINRTLKAYATAILAAEYLLGLVPRQTHDYSQFIRPSELSNWLRASGFTVEDISGINYLPLLDYASLDPDPSVNYLIHARLND